MTGIPTQMNYLLEALESDYCIYKLSIGSQGDMAKVKELIESRDYPLRNIL